MMREFFTCAGKSVNYSFNFSQHLQSQNSAACLGRVANAYITQPHTQHKCICIPTPSKLQTPLLKSVVLTLQAIDIMQPRKTLQHNIWHANIVW